MKYLSIIFICSAIFLMSCGDDADCTQAGIDADLTAGNNKVAEATATYNADMTDDNCKDLKKAIEDQIDLLEGLKSCDNLVQSDLDQNIQIARENLNNVPC